ncbi:hypothetical protein BaRGS_00030719 [Batillaria attramentaria]|uniref:Uncharacterized protein n=1 Tax=Batillaria attramentaria TaxID=370345 RepID=A0ABD0JSE0_9CAEN
MPRPALWCKRPEMVRCRQKCVRRRLQYTAGVTEMQNSQTRPLVQEAWDGTMHSEMCMQAAAVHGRCEMQNAQTGPLVQKALDGTMQAEMCMQAAAVQGRCDMKNAQTLWLWHKRPEMVRCRQKCHSVRRRLQYTAGVTEMQNAQTRPLVQTA